MSIVIGMLLKIILTTVHKQHFSYFFNVYAVPNLSSGLTSVDLINNITYTDRKYFVSRYCDYEEKIFCDKIV